MTENELEKQTFIEIYGEKKWRERQLIIKQCHEALEKIGSLDVKRYEEELLKLKRQLDHLFGHPISEKEFLAILKAWHFELGKMTKYGIMVIDRLLKLL